MYISGLSDEIDKNVDVQFKVLNKLGIKYFEPREIDGKNISLLTLDEAKELKDKMDKAHIKASAIGSPIGKVNIKDAKKEFELFKHVVKIAKILDCRFIKIFSFYNAQNEKEAVISALKEMADYADQENIIILHQNDKDIYGDTAEKCLELLDAVNSSDFRAVFDPANFVQCGENTISAFNMLKKYVSYMNIKDSRDDNTFVPAGAGAGNIKYIVDELDKDGFDGFLCLEPHLEKCNASCFTLALNSFKILL